MAPQLFPARARERVVTLCVLCVHSRPYTCVCVLCVRAGWNNICSDPTSVVIPKTMYYNITGPCFHLLTHCVFIFLMHSAYIVPIFCLYFQSATQFKCIVCVRPFISVACLLEHPRGGHILGSGKSAAHFSCYTHFLISCLASPLNIILVALGIGSVSYCEGQIRAHTRTTHTHTHTQT